MSKLYPIAVADGKYRVNFYGLYLRSYGLKPEHNEYRGNVTKFRMRKIESFCKRKHLSFRINNEYGKRSSNYRDVFFSTHKPIPGNRWFCAYCGKPLKASKVTVDHLFPIGQAKKSLHVQKQMRLLGISSVNSSKNLVPACRSCNQRKGTKMGGWIIRGFFGGRFQWLWYIRWFVRFLALILLSCVIILYLRG